MCRLCKTIHGFGVPSGKLTKNYGQSPFSMGKLTISMAIFHSYVELPEGTRYDLTTHFCSEWTWISRNISVIMWLKIHHPPKGYGMNFNARPFLISCWNPFFFAVLLVWNPTNFMWDFHFRWYDLTQFLLLQCIFSGWIPHNFPAQPLLVMNSKQSLPKVPRFARGLTDYFY